MATRRRTTTRRSSSRKKKLPPWALVLGGLTVGLGVAWGVHLYLERTDARNASLTQIKPQPPAQAQPAQAANAPSPEPGPAANRQPPRRRFDFYTILPEIETVVPEKERKAATTSRKSDEESRYVLQAASYENPEDADQLRATLALNGLEAQIEKVTISGKGDFYRVRLGPYKRLEDTEAPNRQLSQAGIKAMLLKVRKKPAH